MVVMDRVATDTDMVTATDMARAVMDMVVMDMAGMVTATRIGAIIGTTATGTVTVVIGGVVGRDTE